jgi:hypothetical protein
MGFLPLAFSSPFVLLALVSLPALWLLLRITPPRPRAIDFPPLKLILDLLPREETPARTPWWLLALRLAIAGLVIFAMAGPVLNERQEGAGGSGPLLLVLDSGWGAAADWSDRMTLAEEVIRGAERANRPVALLPTGDRPSEITLGSASKTLEKLRGVSPAPYTPARASHLASIETFLSREPTAEVNWISDGIALADETPFVQRLAALAKGRAFAVFADARPATAALAGIENGVQGLSVRVMRPAPGSRDSGIVRAFDRRSGLIGDADYRFEGSALETRALFKLPVELRNEIARLEIVDDRSAGAVALVDESNRRRRVGLVSGATADTAQPLLSPTYYIARALGPYAEVREPKSGAAEAISELLDQKVSMLILADVGTLPPDVREKLDRFVSEGGVLVRFAGSRLAAGGDDLVPVKIRRGGRALGGALSWETPKTLAPFDATSPFFGITLPKDVSVTRQLLAEPDADLSRKTWAALADGTPIVTAERRGAGELVLFHVTADTTWSNLPLSGLFVEMLRRITALAGTTEAEAKARTDQGEVETVAPLRTLDGFGVFQAPPPTAKPISLSAALIATRDHPPGFYGAPDAPVAVNTLGPADTLSALDLAGTGARIEPIQRPEPVDLRPWLLGLALLLFALDSLAVLWLGGGLASLRRSPRPARTAALLIAASLAAACPAPRPALAQEPPAAREPVSPKEAESALTTRLAYVVTGDPVVDETSRAGLAGLSVFLSTRTALDPGDPVGVDPARDELAVYPLIYWPVVAGRPIPGEAAIRKLDAFMKGGGTVIFDTRDALAQRPGGAPTPETKALRQILAGVTVPELEPVPRDHVITKAFYLIDSFPGRYMDGQTWIEALPKEGPDSERPARAGDGVSPIIITSNDLASAWATGRRGEPLYPVVPGAPRQREFAFRAGVNIVMYALTGNYKADQVHVPALLERLGQ